MSTKEKRTVAAQDVAPATELPASLPVSELDLLQLKLCAAEELNVALQVGPLNQRLQQTRAMRAATVRRIAEDAGLTSEAVARRYQLDTGAGCLVLTPNDVA